MLLRRAWGCQRGKSSCWPRGVRPDWELAYPLSNRPPILLTTTPYPAIVLNVLSRWSISPSGNLVQTSSWRGTATRLAFAR